MGWTAGGKTYAAGAKHILNANTTFEAYYENTEPGTPTDKLDVWSSMDYEVDDVPLGSTLPNWTQGQLKPTIYLNKDSANRTIRLYTSESPVSFTNAAGEAIGPFEKELNMGGAANVENDNFIARAMVIKGVKPGDTIDVVYRNGNSADGGLWMYVDKTGEGTKFTSGAKDAIKAYSTEVVPYTDGSPKHYQVLGTATEAGDYYFFSFSNTQWMYVRHSYVDPGLYTATVTYNANGGEGAPDPQTSAERSAWPVSITLSSGAPSRTDGYEFAGWALSATATAAEVQPGDLVSFSRENVTYYAVWSPTNVMVGEIAGALDIGDFEEGYSINDVDSKAKTITVTNLGVASAFEIVSTTSTSSNFSVTPGLFDLKANVNNNVNDSCVITIKPVLGLGNGTYTETFNVVVADEVRGTFTASFKVFGKEQPKATYELWAGEGASVPGIIETGIRSVDSTVTIDSAILPAGTGDMNFTGWTITKADGSEVDFTYDERAEIITFTMPNYDIVITANYNAHLWSRGDVNRDGEIGNADALWLKRYLLELPGYDEFREEMDMNGNGEIGNDDALWLVRHLLELPGYEVIMPW
jgi:uncharacterized repeat protein (TIGR02543 family)